MSRENKISQECHMLSSDVTSSSHSQNVCLSDWECIGSLVEDVCLAVKVKRCEEHRSDSSLPNLLSLCLWKLLYQRGKRSSRRNSHIYIPIFYTETHIARLIKDSSSRGKQGRTENWSGGACCNAKKKKRPDGRKNAGWSPWQQLLRLPLLLPWWLVAAYQALIRRLPILVL